RDDARSLLLLRLLDRSGLLCRAALDIFHVEAALSVSAQHLSRWDLADLIVGAGLHADVRLRPRGLLERGDVSHARANLSGVRCLPVGQPSLERIVRPFETRCDDRIERVST